MFANPLPFIETYVGCLDEVIKEHSSGDQKLSRIQQVWLKFCLMGILLTNSVCWAAFEREGLGSYSLGAISWMFRHSRIDWNGLLHASVSLVLKKYSIHEGVLLADDSDHPRAKRTTEIWKAHKIFDKKTGGYFNGQTLVFLVLVTPKITLPVGFQFHQPDPKQIKWRKEDDRLKKKGVIKSQRPVAPAPDPAYPDKSEQVLSLIQDFRKHHPEVKVKALLADALFGTQAFMDRASQLCGQVQVVSQLRDSVTSFL